ncbi:MAG: hypothetical protein AAGE93_22595 [Bacteroidota bacterium]
MYLEVMELYGLNSRLAGILSSVEFEEEGGIHITGADWYSDDLKLEFAIRTGENDEHQLWEAQITGVRDELIKSDWAVQMQLLEDHPLLWRFNDIQSELYFSKSTDKPYELISSILEAHHKIVSNWYSLSKFINYGQFPFIDLCKSSNALFAKGPKKVLAEYARILSEFKMRPNLFGDCDPKRWTGRKWVAETEILRILIIGESFVIAEDFDFERV